MLFNDKIIDSIDKIYFQDETNFNIELVVPENLTSEYILGYKSQLKLQLEHVTQKISTLILGHQPAYTSELQRIVELQKSISESIRVCSNGRRCLKIIKDGTTNKLTSVYHHGKRESLSTYLGPLTTINDLRISVIQILKLIDNQEDFSRAIKMCKDGKTLLAPYDKYKCVSDLRSKLNDMIELIGERMDTTLSKMLISFDPRTYLKLKAGYEEMDRGEIAVAMLATLLRPIASRK